MKNRYDTMMKHKMLTDAMEIAYDNKTVACSKDIDSKNKCLKLILGCFNLRVYSVVLPSVA